MKNKDYDDKTVHSRYLQRFLSLNSLEEFAKYRLFPNLKEIQESMGMYYAVTQQIMSVEKNITKEVNNVNLYIVGDGVTPRTAALFAFLTKWNCYSIDPALRDIDYSAIQRLKLVKNKIEAIDKKLLFEYNPEQEFHIIILPHSHAQIEHAYSQLKGNKTWIITMPCCVPHSLSLPCIEYRDKYIDSAKNLIKIYCNYMTPKFVVNDLAKQ